MLCKFFAVLGAIAISIAPASAQEMIPDKFIVGGSSPDFPTQPPEQQSPIEKSQALVGQFYTAISPIFLSGQNQTYIRLFNPELTAVTITVRVVGSPSSSTLGIAVFRIPGEASPQYSIQEVLANAGVPSSLFGDTAVSLYATSTSLISQYQNIIFNGNNGFFENMTMCNSTADTNGWLMNVHSSRLSAYPSYVLLHNRNSTQATYRLWVFDAATGSGVGTKTLQTARANTSYLIPVSYIEQQSLASPTASQLHWNILLGIESPSGATTSTYPVILGHIVNNSVFDASLNLTRMCYIAQL